MMPQIPIMDGYRNTVARLEWTGDKFEGEGVIKSDRDHEGQAREIANIISSRSDLSSVQFRARSYEGYAQGWRGFDGTLLALDFALPMNGYYVDWDHIDWPEKETK